AKTGVDAHDGIQRVRALFDVPGLRQQVERRVKLQIEIEVDVEVSQAAKDLDRTLRLVHHPVAERELRFEAGQRGGGAGVQGNLDFTARSADCLHRRALVAEIEIDDVGTQAPVLAASFAREHQYEVEVIEIVHRPDLEGRLPAVRRPVRGSVPFDIGQP